MEPWLENFARASFRRGADTAHDLKTPLNVAVLNLELLRMRMRKLAGDDDEKFAGYAAAIETELRRMGRIFDAYFLLATPPKSEEPQPVDLAALAAEAAAKNGLDGAAVRLSVTIDAHESRIRQALELFFEAASKAFAREGRRLTIDGDGGNFTIAVTGTPATNDFELTRIFKFYHSDAQGNPDLSLAVARLIVETYGGEMYAAEERDKVILRLSFPLGAR